jgi:hypothetical protein
MNPNYIGGISTDVSSILQFAAICLHLLICFVEAKKNRKEGSQLRAFYSVSLK